MRSPSLAALVGVLLLLQAPGVRAADVFINGTPVDGLANQKFEKVNVQLDDKGNVRIDAPGYTVKRVTVAPDPGTVTSEGLLSKRYFVVTEQNQLGATEYDVDFYLNGKLLRTMKSSDEQLINEITKQLKPGKNQVLLAAKKKLLNAESPRSTSKSNVFRVIIGEGKSTAEQVIIEKPIITFTRTAAEQNDITQEFTLTTR